ncbi:hypothetical protein H9P43_003814 [Blastocladiella emersonii ATCC 22665]|nr:hypothetical protein H9P43_003814 [Blastocladiella emersonii ATCC 22665]
MYSSSRGPPSAAAQHSQYHHQQQHAASPPVHSARLPTGYYQQQQHSSTNGGMARASTQQLQPQPQQQYSTASVPARIAVRGSMDTASAAAAGSIHYQQHQQQQSYHHQNLSSTAYTATVTKSSSARMSSTAAAAAGLRGTVSTTRLKTPPNALLSYPPPSDEVDDNDPLAARNYSTARHSTGQQQQQQNQYQQHQQYSSTSRDSTAGPATASRDVHLQQSATISGNHPSAAAAAAAAASGSTAAQSPTVLPPVFIQCALLPSSYALVRVADNRCEFRAVVPAPPSASARMSSDLKRSLRMHAANGSARGALVARHDSGASVAGRDSEDDDEDEPDRHHNSHGRHHRPGHGTLSSSIEDGDSERDESSSAATNAANRAGRVRPSHQPWGSEFLLLEYRRGAKPVPVTRDSVREGLPVLLCVRHGDAGLARDKELTDGAAAAASAPASAPDPSSDALAPQFIGFKDSGALFSIQYPTSKTLFTMVSVGSRGFALRTDSGQYLTVAHDRSLGTTPRYSATACTFRFVFVRDPRDPFREANREARRARERKNAANSGPPVPPKDAAPGSMRAGAGQANTTNSVKSIQFAAANGPAGPPAPARGPQRPPWNSVTTATNAESAAVTATTTTTTTAATSVQQQRVTSGPAQQQSLRMTLAPIPEAERNAASPRPQHGSLGPAGPAGSVQVPGGPFPGNARPNPYMAAANQQQQQQAQQQQQQQQRFQNAPPPPQQQQMHPGMPPNVGPGPAPMFPGSSSVGPHPHPQMMMHPQQHQQHHGAAPPNGPAPATAAALASGMGGSRLCYPVAIQDPKGRMLVCESNRPSRPGGPVHSSGASTRSDSSSITTVVELLKLETVSRAKFDDRVLYFDVAVLGSSPGLEDERMGTLTPSPLEDALLAAAPLDLLKDSGKRVMFRSNRDGRYLAVRLPAPSRASDTSPYLPNGEWDETIAEDEDDVGTLVLTRRPCRAAVWIWRGLPHSPLSFALESAALRSFLSVHNPPAVVAAAATVGPLSHRNLFRSGSLAARRLSSHITGGSGHGTIGGGGGSPVVAASGKVAGFLSVATLRASATTVGVRESLTLSVPPSLQQAIAMQSVRGPPRYTMYLTAAITGASLMGATAGIVNMVINANKTPTNAHASSSPPSSSSSTAAPGDAVVVGPPATTTTTTVANGPVTTSSADSGAGGITMTTSTAVSGGPPAGDTAAGSGAGNGWSGTTADGGAGGIAVTTGVGHSGSPVGGSGSGADTGAGSSGTAGGSTWSVNGGSGSSSGAGHGATGGAADGGNSGANGTWSSGNGHNGGSADSGSWSATGSSGNAASNGSSGQSHTGSADVGTPIDFPPIQNTTNGVIPVDHAAGTATGGSGSGSAWSNGGAGHDAGSAWVGGNGVGGHDAGAGSAWTGNGAAGHDSGSAWSGSGAGGHDAGAASPWSSNDGTAGGHEVTGTSSWSSSGGGGGDHGQTPSTSWSGNGGAHDAGGHVDVGGSSSVHTTPPWASSNNSSGGEQYYDAVGTHAPGPTSFHHADVSYGPPPPGVDAAYNTHPSTMLDAYTLPSASPTHAPAAEFVMPETGFPGAWQAHIDAALHAQNYGAHVGVGADLGIHHAYMDASGAGVGFDCSGHAHAHVDVGSIPFHS